MRFEEKETLKELVDDVMASLHRLVRVPQDDLFALRRTVTRAVFGAYRLGVSSSEARRQSSMEMSVVRLDGDG